MLTNSIKLKNKESIVLVKCGTFYNTYNEDAYTINKILNYKIYDKRVGFPVSSLFDVVIKLNNYNLDVIVVNDKDNILNYRYKD